MLGPLSGPRLAVCTSLARRCAGGNFTCLGAYNPIMSEGCSIVKWKVARYDDARSEISRRKAAEKASTSLSSNDPSSTCVIAAQDFACAREFPRCPVSGERASYWPVCRSVCERVKESCETAAAAALDCSALVDDRRFCTEVVAGGRFHLDPRHGPYDHMVFTASIVFWLWLGIVRPASPALPRDGAHRPRSSPPRRAKTLVWCTHTYSRPHGVTLPLQRFLSFLPAAKTVVIGVSLAFWASCADANLCSYWISALWLNMSTFFDTYLIMACVPRPAARGLGPSPSPAPTPALPSSPTAGA